MAGASCASFRRVYFIVLQASSEVISTGMAYRGALVVGKKGKVNVVAVLATIAKCVVRCRRIWSDEREPRLVRVSIVLHSGGKVA
jgi:hypothetical protein